MKKQITKKINAILSCIQKYVFCTKNHKYPCLKVVLQRNRIHKWTNAI